MELQNYLTIWTLSYHTLSVKIHICMIYIYIYMYLPDFHNPNFLSHFSRLVLSHLRPKFQHMSALSLNHNFVDGVEFILITVSNCRFNSANVLLLHMLLMAYWWSVWDQTKHEAYPIIHLDNAINREWYYRLSQKKSIV